MIHLAHSANVQIYASITLSPSKLLGLDIGTFVTNAMSLLSTTNFDGLDIYITTSLDHVNEDTNSIVMALQSLLMVLQPELLSLMDTNGRTYGLSLVVLPSCDIATTTDESVYTQDFINILKSVGELNLLSYNPPTTNNDIVPTSSPILPTWQQPTTSTTINSTTATTIDSSTTTSKSNDNCQAIEESVAVWGSRGILPDKINVGLSTTTTTTTDNTDVCEQVKYGISSGWNGYFLW
jgi:GH18 family chitinase